ncbi:MAG: hypothetical protein K8R74_13715 [Bacteroidales bacterium]|nr:hypothetical protein [Bacteroidales bacterium]
MTPNPFCFNKSSIKAFVMGADPTNYSKNKKRVELYYAFGIGQNASYFNDILENLNFLGIHLEDVYIQNLLSTYQSEETSKNNHFIQDARKNIPNLKRELAQIKRSSSLPGFLTAYDNYKGVFKEGEKIKSPSDLYTTEEEIPIPPYKNLLNRPLIPLFRHSNYQLDKHPKYKQRLIQYLKLIKS